MQKKYAQIGLSVADDNQKKANVLDTLAQIEFCLGETTSAVNHVKEAIALAPENKEFQDHLKNFVAQKATL